MCPGNWGKPTLSQIDLLSTSDKPSGRRVRIALYVGLCLVVSLAPMVLEIARYPEGESRVAEMLGAFGGLLALAVLTFPAGVVAVMPVFTVAGYLQWFVWIPKYVRRGSKAASR